MFDRIIYISKSVCDILIFRSINQQDIRLPPGYFPPSNFLKIEFLGKSIYMRSTVIIQINATKQF